jgi:hypothetical protein
MNNKRIRGVVAALAALGMVVPAPMSMAAGAVNPSSINTGAVSTGAVSQAVRDVQLQAGGVLVGQVLGGQGKALAESPVVLSIAGREIARVKTDRTGKFQVVGLTGGVYQVTAGGQQSVYRLWAPQTAPPAAQSGLMLVSDSDVIRGQYDCGSPVCGSPVCGSGCGAGGVGNWIANHPILTAGAIGAAIAIPLALDDDDDPPATP